MKGKIFIAIVYLFFLHAGNSFVNAQAVSKMKDDIHRLQVHFSPEEHWINDPNGMVYHNGIYHLFFQYHPYSSVWGPMHWGHATSADLIHWKQQPIAIYPDSLGTIFSGSAVVDEHNTSGFGKKGQVPLVAIFTQHDTVGEKAGRNDFQNQSIAYSLDEGKTWIKYARNPVVKNPGLRDFRDPKVMWYEPAKKWIMTLAAKDRVNFYSSPNLKEWKKESDFGNEAGAHGGGWECPDLFTLDYNGKKYWVLIANINPGGPNKGSATQYFIGSFDGHTFTPNSTAAKWIDYGPDNYAGITWSNTGNRKIFIGWMSNWMYANEVPTEKWRNAMTLPRELKLKMMGDDMFVASEPVKELDAIATNSVVMENVVVKSDFDITAKIKGLQLPCRLTLTLDAIKNFSFVLSNGMGEALKIGYDENNNQYFIDRTKSGKTGFNKDFAAVHTAPRFIKGTKLNLLLVIDASSVELFADEGLSVMTEVFFPNKPYNRLQFQSADKMVIKKITFQPLKSIWP